MAIVHRATINPTKLELIASWLPAQPWCSAEPGVEFTQVGAFRFDDPAGEVGLQVLLVQAQGAGPIYQVPMTYRPAPLDSAGDALMAEMEHSVLGRRYIYDGCHDPIFVAELVRAAVSGGSEVDEIIDIGGEIKTLPKSMHVRGSGDAAAVVPQVDSVAVSALGPNDSVSVVRSGSVEVTVPRVVGGDIDTTGVTTLTGSIDGADIGCLATVRFVAGD